MIDQAEPLELLRGQRCLVTGASGSIGRAVLEALYLAPGAAAFGTDLDYDPRNTTQVDVRNADRVRRAMERYRPTHVFHLAGAKHAPEGELDPAETARTNVGGTENVLLHAGGARVVTASTCKACDPETAYGASKMIAERMTLNAGGSVARFYNVPESSGNVFRLWEDLDPDEPLPVAPCTRFFISLEDAVALILWAAVLDPGRYCADPGPAKRMDAVAEDLYPGRPRTPVPPRRGDRVSEPFLARSEELFPTRVPNLWRVEGPHDPARTPHCLTCLDTGHVCERHPDHAWGGLTGDDCCGGAGMPCRACCSDIPADGTRSIAEAFTPDHLRA